MSQKLSKIKIKNFRSIVDEEFLLNDFTPLVGYNNAGKTNILRACCWLLKKSSLSNQDFHDINLPIEMEAIIDGITFDIINRLDDKHSKKILDYVKNDRLEMKRVQSKPNESIRDIKLYIKDAKGVWSLNPTGIDNAIIELFPDPILINAMENSEEDVSKFKTSTTIGKLISAIIEPLIKEHGSELTKQIDTIRDILGAKSPKKAEQLLEFDKKANEYLESFFPNLEIKIDIPTPEIKEILKSGTIKVFESGFSNDGKDVSSLGNGAQRAIQMALIRQLSDVKSSNSDFTRTLLLIDEPELYMHPQGIAQIKYALKKLSKEGYQVIFATHSPLLVSSKDINSTILIRQDKKKGTIKRKSIKDATEEIIKDAQSQLEMLFSLNNSSQILFCDKVILFEGRTEEKLIPEIFEIITKETLGYNRIAFVKQDGVDNTGKTMKILKTMGLPVKAIVDLDYAFKSAITDGILQKNDTDIIECRKIFVELESKGEINLNDGLPQNKESKYSASEAFYKMSIDKRVKNNIESIYKKLLKEDIWTWKNGSIEKHLGIEGKKEKVWCRFLDNIEKCGIEKSIKDLSSIQDIVNWIKK